MLHFERFYFGPWLGSHVVRIVHGLARIPATSCLAPPLSQLDSKHRRSTPSVQFRVSGIFSAASRQCLFALCVPAELGGSLLPRLGLSVHAEVACITFRLKPLSTLRNSGVYEMWWWAVPVSTMVQQTAPFIQLMWTGIQSHFST